MPPRSLGARLRRAEATRMPKVVHVPNVRVLKISGPIPKSRTGGAAARAGAFGSTPREECAMYRALFARDVFAELDRMQREMQEAFDLSPSIRGLSRGGFPALNMGGTPQSVEIYAFAPGLDPAPLAVQMDRGVLSIAGERPAAQPQGDQGRQSVHINERFVGSFRRVVSLPEDADPDGISAEY